MYRFSARARRTSTEGSFLMRGPVSRMRELMDLAGSFEGADAGAGAAVCDAWSDMATLCWELFGEGGSRVGRGKDGR